MEDAKMLVMLADQPPNHFEIQPRFNPEAVHICHPEETPKLSVVHWMRPEAIVPCPGVEEYDWPPMLNESEPRKEYSEK